MHVDQTKIAVGEAVNQTLASVGWQSTALFARTPMA